MTSLSLKRVFTEAFRRGRRSPAARPWLHHLEARLAPAAQIVADINAEPTKNGSEPHEFVNFNGETYFNATDAIHGPELWKTDGTEAGTTFIKDIEPGSEGSFPEYLTPIGGELFFVTFSPANREPALWKTDGTTAGTVLVKSFSIGYGDDPRGLTAVNGTLFFSVDGPGGTELWKSDGTTAGTVRVADIKPGPYGSYPGGLTAFNGELYFTADDGVSGTELWKSDGTEAGTVPVADINPNPYTGSYPQSLTEDNGQLYFAADDGTTAGRELWKTDGTAAGTTLVADINPASDAGSYPLFLTDVNGVLYFVASDGTTGDELWKFDAGGTARVKDINPGGNSSYPDALTAVNGRLFFTANDGTTGEELWTSDGTDSGTVLVKDIYTDNSNPYLGYFPRYLTAVNGELYFAATEVGPTQGLWKSDGTEAGTVPVKVIAPGTGYTSSLSSLFNADGTLLFQGTDGVHGPELWTSDGTEDGTRLLKDIVAGTGDSGPGGLTDVAGELYFAADDGIHGRALWKSDGTEAGTSMVKDVHLDLAFGRLHDVVNVDGTLFFSGSDGVNGAELWKSDGTEAGTVMVKDINPGPDSSNPSRMADLNGKLMFMATDGVNGYALWSSDGTEAGTSMVKDIYHGTGRFDIEDMTVFGGVAYFSANDDTHGYELWRSDGTEAGTYYLKDINPGGYSSSPGYFTEFGGTLYFAARDVANGRELWKTDGTAAGTALVKDIVLGGGNHSSYPSYFVNAGDALYFAAYDPVNGGELWKTDGTDTGTVMVKDIFPGPDSSDASPVAAINGTVYFKAKDGVNGYELWKSDGTAAGTVMVKDISDALLGSQPGNLTVFNGKLYFTAFNETSGNEIWVTDGTEAGTHLAAQTVGGTPDGSPLYLTVSGGQLYFTASTVAEGNELWSFTDTPDITPPGVTIDQDAGQPDPAEAGPVRFRVVFSEPVTGFDASDVDLSQSTVPGTLLVGVTEVGQQDGTTYEVTVSGMAGDGNVVASIPAGAAKDLAGNDSLDSTSGDNVVRFAVRPTVTINQDPGQADPTTAGPIVFNVVFSEPVTGFDGSKVDLSQSTVGGTLSAAVTPLTSTTYQVSVTGMTGVGQVIARILADQVTDAAGNGNVASTSTDNHVDFFGGGTVGFTAAVLDTVDEGVGTYTVHVHRVGTQGDVTAQFTISAGTASAGDFADNNATHTLHWADGDDSDQTFTIQIIDDTISEARETINVGLTNIVGAIAGITSATVGIDYSDPLGSGSSFTEADGDKVTLRLSPATAGTLQYYLTNGAGPIDRIVLAGTSSTKSTVTLSVRKARGANGTTDIREVIGTGVKTLNMAKANLTGAGISLTGPLGSLTVGNVFGGADILAAGDPTLKTRIKAGAIGDGTVVNVGSSLTSFTALSFGNSDILAPSIGTLMVRGNFSGDVTVSGAGVLAGKPALKMFHVLGAVTGSAIDVTGSVSVAIVGSFVDSHLFAGYAGPLGGGGTYTAGDAIGSFQTTSRGGTFANSTVAADVVKTVSLWAVDDTNGGAAFGVFADTSINSVAVRSTRKSFRSPTDDGIGDFRIKVN
jgi:ELWxxDGT repeat protein